MPRSITPLLAERLDISDERAQSLLQSMLTELRQRAEDEGVQLSDLGTFRKEDGTLTFVPSSSLRRRVNHQFEGLSAEDLSDPDEQETPPALRETPDSEEAQGTTPEPPPSDEAPSDEPSTDEPEAPSESEPPDAPPAATTDDQDIPTIDPIEDDPSGPSAGEEAPQPGAENTEEHQEAGPSGLDPIDTEDAPNGGGPEDRPPESSEEEEEKTEETTEDRSLSPLPIVGGLALILVLAGALWFAFGNGAPWSSGEQETPYGSEEPQSAQTADASASSQTDESAENESDTSDQQTDRFAGVTPDQQDAPNDATSSSNGWTIVVASMSSRSAAEEMAENYAGRFAPAEIVSGTVNGRTTYRVTLGRYPSEAAADRALNDHASRLPPGAWTHRLQ